MNKVYFDKRARKELNKFTKPVQVKFEALFKLYRKTGKLDFPDSRKVHNKLFELRIKYRGQFRGFYSYIKKTNIITLHFFKKKTQKTPIKNLKTARRRLKQYEQQN